MTVLVTAIGGSGHGRASLRSATVGQEPSFGSDADTSPKQTFMECQLNPIEQLQRNAKALAGRDVFGADEILPHAVKALQLVRDHHELRLAFGEEFIRISAYAPPEFIEICMHELRWPEVRDEFSLRQSKALAEDDWRAELVFRGYLAAFEDGWTDADDFYASYFHSPTRS
uniref:hypothetical protein n=1 Tax=unclassified Variovorax TaxID=663243 RepID=UPI0010466917